MKSTEVEIVSYYLTLCDSISVVIAEGIAIYCVIKQSNSVVIVIFF